MPYKDILMVFIIFLSRAQQIFVGIFPCHRLVALHRNFPYFLIGSLDEVGS